MRLPTSAALERLIEVPRIELGRWPTPLDGVDHPALGRLLVKRDDRSGFGPDGRSGVKARKLEGFLAYLQQRGVERFIMPLGNITNLGPDLQRTAAQLGISTTLLIVDDPPLAMVQRNERFSPLAPHVRLIGPSYARAVARLLRERASARLRGERTMIALPSPAHPAAVAGTARGFIEAMAQVAGTGEPLPRAVYVAAASGASVAGFALAEALMRAAGAPPVEIVAVQVVPEPLRLWLPSLVRWTARFWRLGPLPRLNVAVVRDPRHIRYGRFDRGHEETCLRVEERFGFAVDPIYGGKSWSALEAREQAGTGRERPPLFWHCGFTPNWQQHRPAAAAC
jgi:D-cysteine desulfhydrase